MKFKIYILFFVLIVLFQPNGTGDNYMQINNQQTMIEEQIIKRGIKDKRVLEAMSNVHRELFVPKNLQQLAHEDLPLSIGYGQTISQPFIVAFMTEAAMLEPNAKVLEIGTGCGYQTAILSNLCKEVYTIEVIKPLGEKTKKRLEQLNYNNVHVLIGDGYEGWPSASPFDAIIVTAAPENIPQTLVDQLKNGGIMIIPVGTVNQGLIRITKLNGAIKKENLLSVRFVPMVRKIS